MQRTLRCDPIQVSQWKRQLLDGTSGLLTRGEQTKDKQDRVAKEAELFQQIGRLQIELAWLKKISVVLMLMNDASWSNTTIPSTHTPSRQCLRLGLPRSTLDYRPTEVRESTLRIMARIGCLDLEAPAVSRHRKLNQRRHEN
jgi:putative transposase